MKNMKEGLTVVIPAFNEEDKIFETIKNVSEALKNQSYPYQIIVYDDGSTDNTFNESINAATQFHHIKVHREEKNYGVGAAYTYGLENSKFTHISLVPGDNAFAYSGLVDLFNCKNKYNFVVSYRVNTNVRKPIRKVISKICTKMMCFVTGKNIYDAHSMYIFPVKNALLYKPIPKNYSYHLLTLGKLLIELKDYHQIPVDLNPDPDNSSRVLKLNVVLYQILTIFKIAIWRIKN